MQRLALLELRVQIPPVTWTSLTCGCCVLSGRGLCEGPIPYPEDSYCVCARARVCVCVRLSVSIRNSNPIHVQMVRKR